jgi:hypothetical protein
MLEKIEKLKEVGNRDEVVELQVRYAARIKNLQTYQQSPTAACKNDLDAATLGLEQLVGKLWKKYFDTEVVYKNRLELLVALENEGLHVGKSKLYNDSKRLPSDGGLRVEKDGSIRRSSVEAWLAHPRGGGKIAARKGLSEETEKEEFEDLQAEKLRREVSILRTKDERERLAHEREQGKWLPREDFQMELAGRAGVLDVRLGYHLNLEAERLVELVGGSQEHRPALIQALVEMKNKALAEFCNTDTYQVMIVGDEDEDKVTGERI